MNDLAILRTCTDNRHRVARGHELIMNGPRRPHWYLRIDRSVPLAGLTGEGQAQSARGEPPDSGTAAEPADQIVVGKAVLRAPCHEPVDINRIG